MFSDKCKPTLYSICTTHPSRFLRTPYDTSISYPKTRIPNIWFCNKKGIFYLLQLQQNLLCVQGIILYTVIKLTDFFFSLSSSFQMLTQTWFSVQKVNFQLREVNESYPTDFSETKVLSQFDNYGVTSQ